MSGGEHAADVPLTQRLLRAAWANAGAILALAAFGVAAAALWRRVGTPVLSLDDVFRTVFAWEWSREPFFFTERLVWLPMPVILTGIAIRLTGEAFWTALAVDVAASAVAVLFVHRLADRLFGGLAAWVASSLLALTPWVLFLALSRHSEPVLLAAVAIASFYWVRWSATGRERDLALAAVALAGAVLTRYEAWPLGAALPAHAAFVAWRRSRAGDRRCWSLAWSALPVSAIAVWAVQNLLVYGRPVYGGAVGFFPDVPRPGAWGGAWLVARYCWDMNPVLAVLGVLGAALRGRRAPGVCAIAVLAAVVPWWTVSALPVPVAFEGRLLVVPLMMLAPFAGAVVAEAVRPRQLAMAAAAVIVAAELAVAFRLEYPSAPPAMLALARVLHRSGALDGVDAVYVQSGEPRGDRDQVRLGINFARPVISMPLDGPPAPAQGAVLVLNDGRMPPGGTARAIARVDGATAWAICPRSGPSESPTRGQRPPDDLCGPARVPLS